MAATLGMMLGTLLFAPDRLMSFRPRWFDLPMLVWCFSGIPTSLSNGLTLYDGLSDSLGQIVVWGLPYLLGRLYFSTLEDLRYFTVAMADRRALLRPPLPLGDPDEPAAAGGHLRHRAAGRGCGWAAIARTSSSRPGWSAGCG